MLGKVILGWAALGIALTSATQLRISGSPLGPGEGLLALWMAFVAFCLLRNVRFSSSSAFGPFVIYWSIAAVLLAAGSVVAIVLNKQDVPTAVHNALSFAFVGPLSCMLAIRVGDVSNEQYYLSLARATFFTVSAMALILLAASLTLSHLGPIDLWYGGGARFRGWAENPNQLAMFMHPIPFLGAYFIGRAQGFHRKLTYVLAIIICVPLGLATDSDGLKVGWVGAAAVFAIWGGFQLMVRGQGKFLHIAIAYLVVPAVGLAFALVLGDELVAWFEAILEQVYAKGDRGNEGLMAALNGLDAISQSPVVGWGPGSYSGLEHSFDSFEAHNTLIDWGMSTGILGMALYLALLSWCTVRAIRSGSLWLLCTLVAVVADTLFGYSMRQPFFWLMLVLVAVLAGPTARRTASPARLPQEGTMSAPESPAYAPAMRRSRREPRPAATRMP